MLVNVLVLNLLLLVPDGAHNVGEEVAVARVAGVAGRVLLGHPEDVILETSAAASAAAAVIVVVVVVVVVAAAAAALVLMAVSRSAWRRCTATTACTNCWTVLLQSFMLDQRVLPDKNRIGTPRSSSKPRRVIASLMEQGYFHGGVAYRQARVHEGKEGGENGRGGGTANPSTRGK